MTSDHNFTYSRPIITSSLVRWVLGAFWAGLCAGAVAVILAILAAHVFLGLEYGFKDNELERVPSSTAVRI